MNRQQYNDLVGLHADSLYRFVLKNTGNAQISDDIVQESFIALWDHHEKIETTKAKSYLFTAAYRRIIDTYRRDRRTISLQDANEDGENMRIDFDLKDMLDDALSRLPDIQKAVILLRDYEGYAYHEIGEITQLSESQVKVYIFRARCFLRDFIKRKELLI